MQLGLAAANCTFPEYDTRPPDATAGGGSGGTTVAQGGTGATAAAGIGAVGPGGAAEAGAGAAPAIGECAGEQWPVENCQVGCLRRYPDHCYDGSASDDESAPDCGGSCQPCTNEVCTANIQCLSGACQPSLSGESVCQAPLSIQYTAHELNRDVGSTAWSITLANVGDAQSGPAFPLKDLKIRYYFARNGLAEPLLVRATQSNLRLADGQSRELSQTSWTIERTEPVPGAAYDAYVEVAFDDTGQLYPGDHVDLYQQLLTGDPSRSTFDQRANYSFSGPGDAASLHITVFSGDKLLWGLEPRPANPRACFTRAVNLNGPALAIQGHEWQSASQALITTSGSAVSQGAAESPAVSGSLATMLQTGVRLQKDDALSLPVDDGVYLLYLYAVSPGDEGTPSSFTVQGVAAAPTSQFRAQASDGGQVWSRMGPFRVNVSDGKLSIAVASGAITFTGLELWYPD